MQQLPDGLYWNGTKRNIYWVFWMDGKRFAGSTGTRGIREAKKYREAQITQLRAGSAATKGVKLSQLFGDYIARLVRKEQDGGAYANGFRSTSHRTKGTINAQLLQPFGDLRPEQITTDKLVAYRDRRKKEGASVVSINRELGYLRTALRLGTRTTPRKVNPATIPSFSDVINVKAERQARHKGIVTPEQYEKLKAELAPHLKAIFVTVMYAGIRSKELRFIRRDQVFFNESYIQLLEGETKNGESRRVGINDKVKDELKAWAAYTEKNFPDTIWFFHYEGAHLGDWGNGWYAALERAGLRTKGADGKWHNAIRFHDTRRSAATFNTEAGISRSDNQASLGHVTESVNRDYDQSNVVKRTNMAQNAKLGLGAGKPAAIAPGATGDDWKAVLRELKGLLDDGILTAEEFAAEKATVLAGR